MNSNISNGSRKRRTFSFTRIFISFLLMAPQTIQMTIAFTTSAQWRREYSSVLVFSATEKEAPVYNSSPLPPPIRTQNKDNNKRRYQRRRNSRKVNRTVDTMPSFIPKLSDVLKNDTLVGSFPARTSPQPPKVPVRQRKQRGPWQAGYYTSLKTQKRIKNAAFRNAKLPGRTQALNTLNALLHSIPEQCNAANVICALTTSAKAIKNDRLDEKLRKAFYETTQILSIMVSRDLLSTRQICNGLWAIAKHVDRDPTLLPRVNRTSSGSVVGLAETWDLKRTRQNPAEILDTLIDSMATRLTEQLTEDSFSAKEGELNMAAWAFGIVRHRRRPPGWEMEPRLGSVPGREPQQRRQESRRDIMTFEHIEGAEEAEKYYDVDSMTQTELLFDAIAQALVPAANSSRMEYCRWSELANIAWAYATHGRSCSSPAEDLIIAIGDETVRRLSRDHKHLPQSRDLAQIIWSLGILQADNFRLADSLSAVVRSVQDFTKLDHNTNASRPLKRWSGADLVQVAPSLAHARLDELPFLRAIYHEVLERLNEREGEAFQSWEISILLWAQARLHLKAREGSVFERFPAAAVGQLLQDMDMEGSLAGAGINCQEQANIAWSLTVLEEDKSADSVRLLAGIYEQAGERCSRDGIIQLEHAHQLWQALFLLEESSPKAVEKVPSWFFDYLKSRWKQEKSRTKISSARHKSLSHTLQLMGVSHKNEHDEDIDVAIVLQESAAWTHQTEGNYNRAGVKVAVEFDGPNHFTRQSFGPPRTLGHTVLKYRLLKKQGWTVVRVPYFEFDKIPYWASMERQRYLQRLLKTHANLKFSRSDVSEYKTPVPNRQSRFD